MVVIPRQPNVFVDRRFPRDRFLGRSKTTAAAFNRIGHSTCGTNVGARRRILRQMAQRCLFGGSKTGGHPNRSTVSVFGSRRDRRWAQRQQPVFTSPRGTRRDKHRAIRPIKNNPRSTRGSPNVHALLRGVGEVMRRRKELPRPVATSLLTDRQTSHPPNRIHGNNRHLPRR